MTARDVSGREFSALRGIRAQEGIEKFNEQLIVGEPSLAPRLVPLPVRMPMPPAEHQGPIYENQRASGRRYFATPDETPRIPAE